MPDSGLKMHVSGWGKDCLSQVRQWPLQGGTHLLARARRSIEANELTALQWVGWLNPRLQLEPIGQNGTELKDTYDRGTSVGG